MTLETDLILDRRRLKRRLFFWRALAVAVVLVAILALGAPSGSRLQRQHIARLTIDGVIGDDRKKIEAVEHAATDPSVVALIVSINSPGGSVGGGEALHDAIADVAAKKPVVAVMRGMAASAGYMVALPANRIFAREGTLTGSIGVLLETPEFSGLMGKLGIAAVTLVSGPLKDQPSPTHPLSPEGRQVLQGLVNDMYDMFVGMVASARHMTLDQVRQLADGRAYTGRQAKQLGLIDDFGGEKQARAWLAANRNVSADLPVRNIQTTGWAERNFGLHGLLRGTVLAVLGLRADALDTQFDGAMALWQPGRLGN